MNSNIINNIIPDRGKQKNSMAVFRKNVLSLTCQINMGAVIMVSMTELKKKAKSMGITNQKLEKDDLVRAIQTTEGNYPCFKSADSFCDQAACMWREDCIGKK